MKANTNLTDKNTKSTQISALLEINVVIYSKQDGIQKLNKY